MNATLTTYLSRAAQLQARLAQQREAGDEGGARVTRTGLQNLMETVIHLGLLPCVGCGGDIREGQHWDAADCVWRCLPESEVDL